MSKPALITLTILSFQASWNELPHFLVATNRPELYTLPRGGSTRGWSSWCSSGSSPRVPTPAARKAERFEPWEARRVVTTQISMLVPHPRRLAVLVGAGNERTLPTMRLPGTEPALGDIVAAFAALGIGGTAVLRQVVTSGDVEDAGELTRLVELDAGVEEAPDGWVWRDVDADLTALLEPETSRAAVVAWGRERVDGWSPLRPAWSRPGWLADASAWCVEQLEAVGRPVVGVPRQHQLWSLSVVLRCPVEGGDAYFKCSPEIFRSEAAVTRALADRMPGRVPEVIAVDEARGWLLMADLAAPELGEQDESLWHHGLTTHAGIQISWLGRVDELVALGLPVRSLARLAAEVEVLTGGPALAEACRRLDRLGPGPTLVHGDLHPWNVAFGSGALRVFDWTDAAVSHPFVDLATYVFRPQDVAARRRLVEAYVAAWAPYGSPESLREAADLALVVGALYQVQTYRNLLPTLMRNGADDAMAGADLEWIERSVSRLERGLESPR
jgi:hypothetical protein